MNEMNEGNRSTPEGNLAKHLPQNEGDLVKMHYDTLVEAGCTPEEAMKLVDSILGDFL